MPVERPQKASVRVTEPVRRGLRHLGWWLRWWTVYFVPLASRRLRKCRRGHAGPFYDGGVACLACYAPWFGEREFWQTRAAQRRPRGASQETALKGGPNDAH